MRLQLIRITEQDVHNMIREALNQVLLEDKRTDQARARCKEVIRNHFNNASWLEDQDAQNNNMTCLDSMLYSFENEFYHDPNLRKGATMRIEPLICKLAFENGFQQENPNTQKLQRLSAILNLLYNMYVNGKVDLSKIDIVNTTFEDLDNEFGKILDEMNQSETDEINNTQYTRNGEYEIVGPLDYETAHEIGNQSCPTSKLCYTQNENTWNGTYTARGMNNAYVVLKNGWEGLKPVHDDDSESAYDTYGLSMIFVFVDGEGNIAYCNTRWNHEAKYKHGFSVDHAMSMKDISELIGANFFEVFKPNTKWKDMINVILQRLANGEDPSNVFEYCGNFKNGLAVVELNKKDNFITQDGKLLSNRWFDVAYNFHEGFAVVMLNGRWNFINQEGKLLSNQWFDECGEFNNGFAIVRLNEKDNFITQDGRFLSDQWFGLCQDFKNGLAKVILNGKCNYINQEGKLFSNQWFDWLGNFYDGLAKVQLNGEWNYLNQDGDLLSDQWFDKCYDFYNVFAKVKLNGKWNYLKLEGGLLSNQWFDECGDFHDDLARVKLNGKYNFINQEGRFLNSQWFVYLGNFHDGFAAVKLNGEWNFINQEGRVISDQWFDNCDNFKNGFGRVVLNDKFNYITQDGNLLSSQWFDYAGNFNNGFAEVELDEKWYRINQNGEIVD